MAYKYDTQIWSKLRKLNTTISIRTLQNNISAFFISQFVLK